MVYTAAILVLMVVGNVKGKHELASYGMAYASVFMKIHNFIQKLLELTCKHDVAASVSLLT